MRPVLVALLLVSCKAPERDAPAPAPSVATVASAPPAPSASVASIAPAVSVAPAAVAAASTGTPARTTSSAAPSVVIPALPPASFPTGPSGAGHFCFSWRTGHESSNPCYASLASCNAERRALGQTEELTRCTERKAAFCTRVSPGGDLAEGRHCFGDAARCSAFRTEAVGHASTTPCAPD